MEWVGTVAFVACKLTIEIPDLAAGGAGEMTPGQSMTRCIVDN